MPLKVEELSTRSDFHALASAQYDAFEPDIMSAVLYPNGRDPIQLSTMAENGFRQSGQDRSLKFLQVIDSEAENHAIAFAIYFLSYGEIHTDITADPRHTKVDPNAKLSATSKMTGLMQGMKGRHIGNREHIYLRFLGTSAAHRRRGAGTLLLQHGIAFARQARPTGRPLPVFLISSPAGYSTYIKCGFRELDRVQLNAVELGMDEKWGTSDRVLMVWEEGGEHSANGEKSFDTA